MRASVATVVDRAVEHGNAVTAVALGLAMVLLVAGCHQGDSWWPLFILLFLVVGALPAVFGSLRSTGVWGAIGDFCIGAALVSIFAYPTVLRNNEALGDFPYALVLLADVLIVGAVFVNLARLHAHAF